MVNIFKSPFVFFGGICLFFSMGFINSLQSVRKAETEIIRGEAPSLAIDGDKLYMALASGDSIFYSFSTDRGEKFSTPILVAILNGLVSGGGRGPQIICNNDQLFIAAPDTSGNFYSYTKKKVSNNWEKAGRINDFPNCAREGFLSLASNNTGQLFAVWLDLRKDQKNNVYYSRSMDGGKSWLKNQLVYRSPGGSVCECCKPSIAVKDRHVAIMFRNNLNGNRDLYLVQSTNNGVKFGEALKLGSVSWKLNGCPMDGGGVTVTANNIQTVWRRESDIYTSEPGKQETFVSKGRQCAITAIKGSYFIAFTRDGRVWCRKPGGGIIELGRGGSYPKLLAIDQSTALCTWEFENKIYKTVVYN